MGAARFKDTLSFYPGKLHIPFTEARIQREYLSMMQSTDNLPILGREVKNQRKAIPAAPMAFTDSGRKFRS